MLALSTCLVLSSHLLFALLADKKHEDSLLDDSPRVATVLIYLATAQEGGETSASFKPLAAWLLCLSLSWHLGSLGILVP